MVSTLLGTNMDSMDTLPMDIDAVDHYVQEQSCCHHVSQALAKHFCAGGPASEGGEGRHWLGSQGLPKFLMIILLPNNTMYTCIDFHWCFLCR